VTVGSGGVATNGAAVASDAITTVAAAGNTLITTNGVVNAGVGANTGNGINATTTAGGAMTVTTWSAVTGGNTGIIAT
jgi:hypothetical protein